MMLPDIVMTKTAPSLIAGLQGIESKGSPALTVEYRQSSFPLGVNFSTRPDVTVEAMMLPDASISGPARTMSSFTSEYHRHAGPFESLDGATNSEVPVWLRSPFFPGQ